VPSSLSIPAATLTLLYCLPSLAAIDTSPLLSYSTYLGGATGSFIGGFAVDSSGYAYVSGGADPSTFPFTAPPPPSCWNFLAKLNLTGTGLVWARCLPVLAGGPIALDRSGSIYVAGNNNDSVSAVLTKLSPDATNIVYSVTIPDANVRSIAVDADGSLYASGLAQPGLQTTPGAYQTRFPRTSCFGGGNGNPRRLPPPCVVGNAFALKLNPSGAIKYVTFLPASGAANAIAVDSQGNIWTTGRQEPNPTVFVAKLDAAGANLLFLDTFSGGENHYDEFHGIAVDNEDSACVVGHFVTGGASLPEGFIRKYTAAGKLVYEKSAGGSPAVAVDAQGDAYFGISGPDPACGGQWFTTHIMALSPDASSTVSDTCFPAGYSFIALDGHGGLYLAGTTQTTVFLTTFGAFQTKFPGGPSSGYIAKYDLTRPSGAALVSLVNAVSSLPGIGTGTGELDGAVAPGEIVTLIGHDFPSSDASMKVTFTGPDGNRWPAPLLSTNSKQITVAVPFEVAPPQTLVSISTNSETVDLTKVPVVGAQPAVVIAAASQPAILNQDGTLNTSANPARAGSQLSVFLMGAGQYNGVSLPDGSLGPSRPPFPALQLGVSGGIAGPRSSRVTEQVTILFAGQAPGLLAGISQINLRLPDDAPAGPGNLCLYVGGFGVVNAGGLLCTLINISSP
jgi:uncharacterized protein (TIGR03437 family)